MVKSQIVAMDKIQHKTLVVTERSVSRSYTVTCWVRQEKLMCNVNRMQTKFLTCVYLQVTVVRTRVPLTRPQSGK